MTKLGLLCAKLINNRKYTHFLNIPPSEASYIRHTYIHNTHRPDLPNFVRGAKSHCCTLGYFSMVFAL